MTAIEPQEVEAEAAVPLEPETSVFVEIYWPYLWDDHSAGTASARRDSTRSSRVIGPCRAIQEA
jgi:hypothetical protein